MPFGLYRNLGFRQISQVSKHCGTLSNSNARVHCHFDGDSKEVFLHQRADLGNI